MGDVKKRGRQQLRAQPCLHAIGSGPGGGGYVTMKCGRGYSTLGARFRRREMLIFMVRRGRVRSRCQSGFTVIELLVVVAILAVIGGLAVIGLGAMRQNADETGCRADVDTYQSAVEAYRLDTNNIPSVADLVSGSNAFIKRPSRFTSTMSVTALTGVVTNSACP